MLIIEANSKREVRSFVACGKHTGKDNVLFHNKIDNNTYLLLHGSENGKVVFNETMCSLDEVNIALQKEPIFAMLKYAGVEVIKVLCCYGGCVEDSMVNGFKLETYFNNETELNGYVVGDRYFSFLPA